MQMHINSCPKFYINTPHCTHINTMSHKERSHFKMWSSKRWVENSVYWNIISWRQVNSYWSYGGKKCPRPARCEASVFISCVKHNQNRPNGLVYYSLRFYSSLCPTTTAHLPTAFLLSAPPETLPQESSSCENICGSKSNNFSRLPYISHRLYTCSSNPFSITDNLVSECDKSVK